MNLNFNKLMRKQIQNIIDKSNVSALANIQKQGWIKIIRKSLGMSVQDLAHRLDCQPSNVTLLENNEISLKIKLETLEKVATAMNCRLVYAFMPQSGSLDDIVKKQIQLIAHQIVRKNNHSMKLEEQGISEEQMKQQEDDVYRKILHDVSAKIWAPQDEN